MKFCIVFIQNSNWSIVSWVLFHKCANHVRKCLQKHFIFMLMSVELHDVLIWKQRSKARHFIWEIPSPPTHTQGPELLKEWRYGYGQLPQVCGFLEQILFALGVIPAQGSPGISPALDLPWTCPVMVHPLLWPGIVTVITVWWTHETENRQWDSSVLQLAVKLALLWLSDSMALQGAPCYAVGLKATCLGSGNMLKSQS